MEISRNQYFRYFIEIQNLYDEAKYTWSSVDLKLLEDLLKTIRFYYQFAPKKEED